MEKRDMDQNHPELIKERDRESLMEERLQTGANKWRKGLFEERSVDKDGDEQM